jgi:hypothetical protein
VGSVVRIQLVVGEKFRGEPLPRNPALIAKFVLVSSAGEQPVSGRAGDDPAGSARIGAPGLQVIGYRSLESPLSLEAEKFEQYLREEGLEGIVALRARRGESRKPSRELFSRDVKSLLCAGGRAYSGEDRALGFPLELLAEKNPCAAKPGDELPVRLLYEGKPLAGALVAALPHEEPDAKLSQRTDAKGRVRLRLPKAGVWLVKAVHMVEAPAGTDADWQSLWASLTFEVPAQNPVKRVP